LKICSNITIKALLLMIFTGFLLFLSSPSAIAMEKDISIVLDGDIIKCDVKPYIDSQNRTIVPIRFIGENLGFDCNWDQSSKIVTVSGGGTKIILPTGKREAIVNGKTETLDTNAVIKNGRVMVPLRFIAETLSLIVDYKMSENLVSISSSGNSQGGNGLSNESVLISNAVAVVSRDLVNIRKGPGTNYSIITQTNKGSTFKVVSKKNDWYEIVLENGTGWIAGYLLTVYQDGNLPSRSEEPGENRGNTDNLSNSGDYTIISEVEVGTEGEEVTVTLKGNRKLNYTTFSLDNPLRVVIDFSNSILKETNSNVISIPVNCGLVQNIRIAQFSDSQVRIVADVKGPVGVKLLSSDSEKTTLILKANNFGNIGLAGKTIVIDPGHASIQSGGGSDPGAVGPSKLYEKDVVLDVAQKLKGFLEAKGAKVILTRTGDTKLSLKGRADVANNNNADIFVSIHTNASVNKSANGTETYFYGKVNGQSQAREKLAKAVNKEIVAALGRQNRGVKEANFAVLRYTSMPSILVEIAFISNNEEEKLLADPAFRIKAAQGIANGIEIYFSN
jgi:N-acetylmuramoyl-L-alanine amidase